MKKLLLTLTGLLLSCSSIAADLSALNQNEADKSQNLYVIRYDIIKNDQMEMSLDNMVIANLYGAFSYDNQREYIKSSEKRMKLGVATVEDTLGEVNEGFSVVTKVKPVNDNEVIVSYAGQKNTLKQLDNFNQGDAKLQLPVMSNVNFNAEKTVKLGEEVVISDDSQVKILMKVNKF